MLRRVTLVRADVSEELNTSIVRVRRIGELGTTIAVASNRRTLKKSTLRISSFHRVLPVRVPTKVLCFICLLYPNYIPTVDGGSYHYLVLSGSKVAIDSTFASSTTAIFLQVFWPSVAQMEMWLQRYIFLLPSVSRVTLSRVHESRLQDSELPV
jgi:hypothetical protein